MHIVPYHFCVIEGISLTYIGTAGKAGNHHMKFIHRQIHRNSATDRTHPLLRVAAWGMCGLLMLSAFLPTVAAAGMTVDISYESAYVQTESEDVTIAAPSSILGETRILHPAKISSLEVGMMATATIMETIRRNEADRSESSEEDQITEESDGIGEIVEEEVSESPSVEDTETEPEMDLYDPDLPVTQELLARRMEASMDKQVRGGSKIYYPWPSGAMAVDLYKDGRQILKGQVADIGGTVYVPVQRFADLFGSFKTVYTEATEQVVITGTNLSITVKVGDPYITVNERIFYTGKKVISLGGWIFVPLTSMCKALNATVNIRSGYYDAFITSGDVTGVKWGSAYYDATDLYWLSRIISAEAKGEPFAGQIAVGNVVLNRVRSSQFPNTVKGVIFDTKYGTQFSPVASGTIYQAPTASAVMAAKVCLEGYSLSTQMIYFYNPSIATSTWIGRTRPYIMTIGNHKFYG